MDDMGEGIVAEFGVDIVCNRSVGICVNKRKVTLEVWHTWGGVLIARRVMAGPVDIMDVNLRTPDDIADGYARWGGKSVPILEAL